MYLPIVALDCSVVVEDFVISGCGVVWCIAVKGENVENLKI